MLRYPLQICWLTFLGLLCASANCSRADIYEWEYIDPLDPGQGKQQSTTLVPDGAGLDAVPDADLSYQDLTMAYLIGSDLTEANLREAALSNADLGLANLENASLYASYLDGVNFTDAIIRGANLRFTVPRGFTAAQLYSTASYQAQDLAGINLENNNLTGWDFSGQDLSQSSFYGSPLINAQFSGATLTQASFIQTELNGANFTNANLTGARLYYSSISPHPNISNAVFTNATIRGVSFEEGALSESQLYSTASYQAKNLQGVLIPATDMSDWNLAGQDLTNANFDTSNLTNVSFSQANLTNVNLKRTNLTDANLAGALILGADFSNANGFTSTQLFSTASYQMGDLSGVKLYNLDLSGAIFANFNLTDSIFYRVALIGTGFSGATIRGANFSDATSYGFTSVQLYSSASYQSHDLSGIRLDVNDMTGWNFADQNLSDATMGSSDLTSANFQQAKLVDTSFNGASLTNANISGSDIRGARFGFTTSKGFTSAQLYSTASYAERDLRGVFLGSNDLSGWSFAGVDLTGANFSASTLAGTDFTGATIRDASFASAQFFTPEQLYSTASYQEKDLTGISLSGNLTGWNFAGQNLTRAFFGRSTIVDADFSGSDTRGSAGHSFSGAITTNMIGPLGMIADLDLTNSRSLLVRDFDGKPDPRISASIDPIPITVTGQLLLDATSTLELRFEADEWDSQIGFETGLSIALAGTLLLDFTDDVPLLSQLGRTLQVFNWTGVTPTGQFFVQSPYTWDLSQLYTTGEVTLTDIPTLPGDFDADGDVDGRDYLAWQRGDSPDPLSKSDLTAWQANYGSSIDSLAPFVAIPEPRTLVILFASIVITSLSQRSGP